MTVCTKCGLPTPAEQLTEGVCPGCRGEGGKHRPQLPSMSHVMDTKSFMIPARRRIIWVWAGVSLGLLLLGELVYLWLAGRL